MAGSSGAHVCTSTRPPRARAPCGPRPAKSTERSARWRGNRADAESCRHSRRRPGSRSENRVPWRSSEFPGGFARRRGEIPRAPRRGCRASAWSRCPSAGSGRRGTSPAPPAPAVACRCPRNASRPCCTSGRTREESLRNRRHGTALFRRSLCQVSVMSQLGHFTDWPHARHQIDGAISPQIQKQDDLPVAVQHGPHGRLQRPADRPPRGSKGDRSARRR